MTISFRSQSPRAVVRLASSVIPISRLPIERERRALSFVQLRSVPFLTPITTYIVSVSRATRQLVRFRPTTKPSFTAATRVPASSPPPVRSRRHGVAETVTPRRPSLTDVFMPTAVRLRRQRRRRRRRKERIIDTKDEMEEES